MAVIRAWLTEHGHGPTVREIGTRVGLSSTSSVAHQLAQLEERGLISRTGRDWSSCRLESPTPPGAACEAADGIRPGPRQIGFEADRAV